VVDQSLVAATAIPVVVEGDTFPEEQARMGADYSQLNDGARATALSPVPQVLTHVPPVQLPPKKKVVWASILCKVASSFLMPHLQDGGGAAPCAPEHGDTHYKSNVVVGAGSAAAASSPSLRQKSHGGGFQGDATTGTTVRDVVNADKSRYWVIQASRAAHVYHHWHQLRGRAQPSGATVPIPEWQVKPSFPAAPTPFALLHPQRAPFQAPVAQEVRKVTVAFDCDLTFPYLADAFATVTIGGVADSVTAPPPR
jgi:hypothetical protein